MPNVPTLLLTVLTGACANGAVALGDGATSSADCPDVAVEPGAIAYGNVLVGQGTTEIVTVRNPCNGAAALEATVAIDGDAAFSILADHIVVPSGGAEELAVVFTPPDNASHAAVLVLATNVADKAVVTISLAGGAGDDSDGDGYSAPEDCDDGNSAVHPGAEEEWYDGVDANCDGADDYDQDGDGYRHPAGGGDDCDDEDPGAYPGAVEADDGIDNDCDSLVDEDFVRAGDVLVSEVMHHPSKVLEPGGEWFEIRNRSQRSVDLQGWVISGADGDAATIDASLVLPAETALVLGASDDADVNGGAVVHYAYGTGGFSLGAADSITLSAGPMVIASLSWTETWPSVDGRSLSLDPDHANPTDMGNRNYWCAASSIYGLGDRGSPGSGNDQCTSVDEDGDGYSPDQGDCDDTDPEISPGADEALDGIDNDCDGALDDVVVDDVAAGEIDGGSNAVLGATRGLGTGDVTGDGTPDLLLGASNSNSYAGVAYVIDGNDHAGLSGAASSNDALTVNGEAYNYLGTLDPRAGDLDGDGRADLVIGGGEAYSSYYDGSAVLVFYGSDTLSGNYDQEDADVAIDGGTRGGSYGDSTVLSSLDRDGDGLDDLVYGSPWANEAPRYYLGAVYIFDGAGLSGVVDTSDADTTVSGASTQDYFGYGLGGGDIDGDGYDELLVGAPGVDDEAAAAGAWYRFDGDAYTIATGDVDDVADGTILGQDEQSMVGFGNILIQDVDADGATDLAFGGFASDAVYIFSDAAGMADDTSAGRADITLTGESAGTLGFALAAGDLDGDSVDELIVGDPGVTSYYSYPSYWWYSSGSADGVVYVLDATLLADGPVSGARVASITGEDTGDCFGAMLADPADFDGDGSEDLLVAAPRAERSAGRAYVVRGW